jgi:peptidoglycan/LPS O-acetylase OafA/YrhL
MTATAPRDEVTATGDRSRNLDVLRAVAALMVLVTHAYPLGGRTVPLVADNATDVLLAAGPSAVWLFFAISGYVISRSFVQALVRGGPLPSVGGFAVRRAARLYPLYWCALAVTVVLVGTEKARPWELVAHVSLLHTLVPDRQQAILPPAWTLTLELVFYAAVAAGALALRRHRPITPRHLAAGVMALWALSIVWTASADLVGATDGGLYLRLLFPSMLSMFCPGILLAIAEAAPASSRLQGGLRWVDGHRTLVWVLALTACAIGAAGALADPDDGTRRFLLLYDAARVPFSLGYGAVLVLARRAPEWRSPLARRLAVVGDWSYGVYLLHAVWAFAIFVPNPGLVPLSLPGFVPFAVHVVWLLAVTLPSAWAAHVLIERPAMEAGRRWSHRLSDRRTSVLAPEPAG